MEAISRLCLELSLSALGDPGGEEGFGPSREAPKFRALLCPSATQNSCVGHQN